MDLFSKDEDINSLALWISVFVLGTGQTFIRETRKGRIMMFLAKQ